MEIGTPFVLEADKDFKEYSAEGTQSGGTLRYSKTNIWNSSFESPEISCDFNLLHQDLMEIKSLICDIKDCLKDFFADQTE